MNKTRSGLARPVLRAAWAMTLISVGATMVMVAAAPACARVAPRPNPFADKARLFVLTDIGNEPDDQMSMVRLLLYANEIDIEGLAAVTSTWLKKGVRPQTLQALIDAYREVCPSLMANAGGLRRRSCSSGSALGPTPMA